MGSPGFTCCIVDHLLAVSVVGADKHLSVHFFKSFHRTSYAGIYCFHSLDRGFLYTGMADHIGICKVDDDHIIFSGSDGLAKFVADLRSAHLRLEIIGRNLRRFDKDTILAFVRLLYAAVEEEGYVRIFFGLGDTGLCHMMRCKVFSERVMQKYLVESDKLILNRLIVIGEAYIGKLKLFLTCKALKIIIAECSGDLSCSVGTEVEEHDRIFVGNDCDRLSVFFDHGRFDELIRHTFVIGRLYSFSRICSLYAFALRQSIVCQVDSLPAIVTVHRIVTSRNNADLADTDLFHLCLKLFDKSFARCGRSIAAVKEAVYIHLFQAFSLCHLKQAVKMCIVAVNTAVGKQAHKVNGGIVIPCILHGSQQRFVLKEVAVFDLFRDSCKLLVDDPAGTHIQMSDLRVSHLTVRKAYSQSAGVSFYKRIIFHQGIDHRSVCLINSVCLMSFVKAKAVKDHKYSRFLAHSVLLYLHFGHIPHFV